MSQKEVSVIIPTYNRCEYLKEALQSVLEQTVAPKEIIIVDDGSTDNTRQYIETILKSYPQIVYLWQKNLGASAARNRGILSARCPVIAFLDSDDLWLSSHLQESLRCFEIFPEAGCVMAKYELKDPGNQIDEIETNNKYKRRDYVKEIASINIEKFYLLDTEQLVYNTLNNKVGFSTSTIVIDFDKCSRHVLFDECLSFGEDIDFRLQLSKSNIKIAYIDTLHSLYRVHKNNQILVGERDISKLIETQLANIKHTEKRLIYCLKNADYQAVYDNLAIDYSILAGCYCSIGDYAEGYKWNKLSYKMKKNLTTLKHVMLYKIMGNELYKRVYEFIQKARR